MRKTKKQYGRGATISIVSNSFKKVQKIIDKWVTDGDVDKFLDLNNLDLTSLPKLPNNLKQLNCCYNKLTKLPTLPDSLKVLFCDHNELTILPRLPDNLKILKCNKNKLKTLPILPNSLKKLDCGKNKLTSLPKLPENLEILYCGDNELTSLPKLPDSLKVLFCDHNELTILQTLPDSLTVLFCEKNNLPEIFYREEPNEYIDDIADERVIELRYLNRIRKLQKSKTNITNTIKSHSTEKKRNVFANTTFKNMPKNVVKEIANYLNEKNLENININSLKPSNVKRGETKKLKKV